MSLRLCRNKLHYYEVDGDKPKCPECRKLRKAREYQRNKEKCNQRSKDWYSSNKEFAKKYIREWQKNNPDKRKETCEKWIRENIEAVREVKRRLENKRRAKMNGSYTQEEWNTIVQNQSGRCKHCGIECFLTVDHIIPISRGGLNISSNLQGLCRSCNSRKHNKLESELTYSTQGD